MGETYAARDVSHQDVAARFVEARKRGRGLATFPGPVPRSLDDAYAIQAHAIDLWPDHVAGWKVGRLTPALADRYGIDRFIGPVFASFVTWANDGRERDFPVFTGGSAAFEAEYVAMMKECLPPQTGSFSPTTARHLVKALHIGVEIAGSPLAGMPQFDSLASIADLGNNNGQIIGASLPLDLLDNPVLMPCATRIDGNLVCSANAADLPGGPLAAITFALTQATRLGRPISAGQFISTGAVTGMHWISVGQRCDATFGPWGRMQCRAVPVGRA